MVGPSPSLLLPLCLHSTSTIVARSGIEGTLGERVRERERESDGSGRAASREMNLTLAVMISSPLPLSLPPVALMRARSHHTKQALVV